MNATKRMIGIVGGGQLGRMLTDAAHKLGFGVVVLDPTPSSPAGQVAEKQIIGSFKDKKKIIELAKICDFITFEIEGVNAETLEKLEKKGKKIHPAPKILQIIKDKFAQKVFLSDHNIPVAKFALINDIDDAAKQGEIFGYPFLIKARFDAYDGRGNYLVKSKKDILKAFEKLTNRQLYAEEFVPFTKELAVVSARDLFGTIVSFPVVETIHENNICHIVRSPAPVDPKIKISAKKLGSQVLSILSGVGTFAVEMFLTKDGKILVNEIAPRVHNSGHHTIEAFNVSQFEQHIRAITGVPVQKIKKNNNHAVMVNILGKRNGVAKIKGLEKAQSIPNTEIHIYGKLETRMERKMGHITVLSDTLKKAEENAKKARKHISI